MLFLSVQPEANTANVQKSAAVINAASAGCAGVTVSCSGMKVSDLRAGIVPLKATQSSVLVMLIHDATVGTGKCKKKP